MGHDLSADRRTRDVLRLEYLTILLAAAEAVVALLSGIWASSVVLVAFGADSVIEMLSALVVLGQLSVLVHARAPGHLSAHRAHRVLGVLFFTLALYVTLSATVALVSVRHPRENIAGFVVSAASSVLMPLLAWRKRCGARVMKAAGQGALARLVGADAAETALCATLALSTLVGITLASWDWWWADPLASLAVVYFALREGRDAWECEPD